MAKKKYKVGDSIKIDDYELISIANKMAGTRSLLEELARISGEVTHELWRRAREVYPDLDFDGFHFSYNHISREIEVQKER